MTNENNVEYKGWEGFIPGEWQTKTNVRDFIQRNYKPYTGAPDFLAPATARTERLLRSFEELCRLESERGGVIGVDNETVSSLTSYPAAYLRREDELIFGLQCAQPLVRGIHPFGGIRMARSACRAYGYELSEKIEDEFKYRTTHNDGVFRVYTETMRQMRHAGILTGLPDAYGRGRIIGDYRRIALYGVDRLIDEKKRDKREYGRAPMNEERIRLLEELYKHHVE